MIDLPGKIVQLHRWLADAELPHAFGGALALAWCTERARGTIDIDINVFVGAERMDHALAALLEIKATAKERQALRRDGQVRLWWGQTPVDLFLNTTPYHERVATRVRLESFMGERVPFLACMDVAVFKAFFNRTKDWADIEAMRAAGTLDIEAVKLVIAEYLGVEDERVAQLERIAQL